MRAGGSHVHATVDGRPVVVFSGDDHLGLAVRPEVVFAAAVAARELGVGSTGPRQSGGAHLGVEELEAEVARFCGAEAAVLAPSSHTALLAALQSVGGPDARVVCDQHGPATLHDGARLARGATETYPRGDLAALDRLLRRGDARAVVAVEAVSRADGTAADLAGVHRTARRHDAWVVVDETHAVGVVGDGRGGCSAARIDLRDPGLVRVIGLGAALGTGGGCIAGSGELRSLVLNRGRALQAAPVVPHPTVAAARVALRVLAAEPELVRRLQDNARTLRGVLTRVHPDGPEDMPIVAVPARDPRRALALERSLLRRGHLVETVRPPTVLPAASRLRLTVSATHGVDELLRLAADLLELTPWEGWP